MSKAIIIFVVILSTCSNLQSQQLSGQIFEISLDKRECVIIAKCSCCSSELFFISDRLFCLVDYCKDENINMTGTYEIINDSLILIFKPKIVRFGIAWEGERMNSKGQTYLKSEKKYIRPLIFTLSQCSDSSLMLNNNKYEKYRYGLRTRANDEHERIYELTHSKEWRLLFKK